MIHHDKYDCRYYPGQRCNHVWCGKVQGKLVKVMGANSPKLQREKEEKK